MKLHEAAHLLGAWIQSYGRFDLKDVADRKGVLQELEYLISEYTELMYDDLNTDELEEFYLAQTQPKTDWVKDLFSRLI